MSLSVALLCVFMPFCAGILTDRVFVILEPEWRRRRELRTWVRKLPTLRSLPKLRSLPWSTNRRTWAKPTGTPEEALTTVADIWAPQ